MNDNEKVKIIRKSYPGGITLLDFAKALGLRSAGSISLMERGERNVTERVKNDIMRVYNVNPVWWETGEGEIFLQKTATSFEEATVGIGVVDELLLTMWPKLTEQQKREHLKRILDDIPPVGQKED